MKSTGFAITHSDKVVEEAMNASKKSYTFNSDHVGAALLTRGCNVYLATRVESATRDAAISAERSAIVKAVSERVRESEALAVVADA